LRFSLDRKFSSVDTAIPDSGDVEAPDGPSRGCLKVRVSPRSSPGSKRKKTEREVPAPRLHAKLTQSAFPLTYVSDAWFLKKQRQSRPASLLSINQTPYAVSVNCL
jgi:hypothetical protein